MSKRRFGPYTVELSRQEKVLFPGDSITKGDLVDYYEKIAGTMLPHLKDRPLVLHRFPDGIAKKGFYHKDAPDHFPDWIKTRSLKKKEGGKVRHVICDKAATLIYLANQGCITPHTWLSRQDKPHHPDQLVFDLDPASDDFDPVKAAARLFKELFDELGLRCYVKTSGSRGLHVMVPLDRRARFDQARSFARDAARLLAQRHPDRLTVAPRRNRRRGRLYLDTARNAYGQTVAPPYAVRPKEGAPVATPLSWDELDARDLDPQGWNIQNIFQRLGQVEDPWGQVRRRGQSLSRPRRALDRLLKKEAEGRRG